MNCMLQLSRDRVDPVSEQPPAVPISSIVVAHKKYLLHCPLWVRLKVVSVYYTYKTKVGRKFIKIVPSVWAELYAFNITFSWGGDWR